MALIDHKTNLAPEAVERIFDPRLGNQRILDLGIPLEDLPRRSPTDEPLNTFTELYVRDEETPAWIAERDSVVFARTQYRNLDIYSRSALVKLIGQAEFDGFLRQIEPHDACSGSQGDEELKHIDREIFYNDVGKTPSWIAAQDEDFSVRRGPCDQIVIYSPRALIKFLGLKNFKRYLCDQPRPRAATSARKRR